MGKAMCVQLQKQILVLLFLFGLAAIALFTHSEVRVQAQNAGSASNTDTGTDTRSSSSGFDSSSTRSGLPSSGSGSSSSGSGSTSSGSLKLFGRIEQLREDTGASIPLKMQSMSPRRDASLDAGTSEPKTASTSFDSIGIDLRGSWSGELQIVSSSFDGSYFTFDRVEAERESALLKPGSRGFTTVTFYRGKDSATHMDPCRIVFITNLPGYGDYTYALHLGDLKTGTGVTGNELKSQLMKNSLKELAPGVIEQEIVTRDYDRNPKTNKSKMGYSESVLRFTRIDQKHIYLQAASVSYDSKGKFQYKVMLAGNMFRARGD